MGFLGLAGKTEKISQSLVLLVIVLAVMFSISQTIGLGKGGFTFESVRNQFNHYVGPGIGAAFGIFLLVILELFVRKGDIIYGNGLGFASAGDEPHYKARILGRTLQLTLLSLIVFSIVALASSYNQQTFLTFTGVGTLQQQFTKFDNALFSATLVTSSENLQAAFILALSIFAFRIYARKKNMGRNDFKYASWILGALIVGAFGLVNHLSRYANQDVALLTVFMFWFLGGLITMISGSFIPFYVAHAVNNGFYELSRSIGSKDTTVIYIISFIVATSLLYVYLYVIRPGGKKGNES